MKNIEKILYEQSLQQAEDMKQQIDKGEATDYEQANVLYDIEHKRRSNLTGLDPGEPSFTELKLMRKFEKRKRSGEKTGIENEDVPNRFTLNHFWNGLRQGIVLELKREEIEEIVDAHFKKYIPMSNLSDEELRLIRLCFIESIGHRANSHRLIGLGEKITNQLFEENIKGRQSFEDLKNPDSEISKSIVAQGMRHFFKSGMPIDETYSYTKETYDIISANIRKKTGREKLKILDVGGANGRALNDIKQYDANIETYNLSVDEEPAMYDVDHFILCPAEYMPKDLEESMDFVVSRTAWRYFTYPDVALKNVIKSLSIGGRADLDINSDKSWLEQSELKERYEKIFKKLTELQGQGFIEIFTDIDFSKTNYVNGHLIIEKKKSTKKIEI